MKITTTRPWSNSSILTNTSSGVHPNPCGEIYFRRDMEKELVAKVTKEISDEIDWEVEVALYKEVGWTEVKLQTTTPSGYVHEIMEWLGKNRTGHVRSRGNHYMFENAKDATLFILKWS